MLARIRRADDVSQIRLQSPATISPHPRPGRPDQVQLPAMISSTRTVRPHPARAVSPPAQAESPRLARRDGHPIAGPIRIGSIKLGGVDLDDWADAVSRYAARPHARAGQGRQVVSQLALCSTVVRETQAPGGQADVLGADPLSAAVFAARLLADPRSLAAAGAGAWVPSGHGRRAAQSARP